jgi:hypothetical protein
MLPNALMTERDLTAEEKEAFIAEAIELTDNED